MAEKPEGEAALKFLERWEDCSGNVMAKAQLLQEYGGSIRRLRGWAEQFRKDKAAGLLKPEAEKVYLPYPKFKLKPFALRKGQRDEEDIVIVLTDHHPGKITPSYDIPTYNARMDKLLDDTMLIINLHRPIRNAHIFSLGDMVQGENVFQGSNLEEAKGGVRKQIREIAVPTMSKYIASLKQGVDTVNFYGVRGNHGRYDRISPPTTNWDLFFYDALAASLANQAGINIHYSENFSLLVNIKGFRFFLIHGDQCKGNAAVPVIAMRRKMAEWYANVGGFNHAYAGHFHSEYQDKVNSLADYTIAPPLVTGDEWAVEKIGRISYPQQLCFGVHEKYGRTWRYSLYTDEGYLPQKFDEPEGIVG